LSHNPQALAEEALSEESLAAVQRDLERFDFRDILLGGMRGEMASGVAAIDWAKRDVHENAGMMIGTLQGLESGSGPEGSSEIVAGIARGLARLIPSGWFDQNQASHARLMYRYYVEPLKRDRFGGMIAGGEEMEATLGEARISKNPYTFLPVVMMPAFGSVGRRYRYLEAMNEQAIVACTLERYFLAEEAYPEGLESLLPRFLEAVPVDGMDGEPMRYGRVGERYELWSVGWDGVDDEGRRGYFGKKGERPRFQDEEYLGDWVWGYSVGEPD
jgi:hypothetical protein